jgi:hypothetical protein
MLVLADYSFRQREFSQPLHPKFARQAIEKQQDRFYFEDEGLSASDVVVLVRQIESRKQARLARAHAEMRGEDGSRFREPIPESVAMRCGDAIKAAAWIAGRAKRSGSTTSSR